MDSKRPYIRTKFWIAGEKLDPNDFSRLIGIQPTKSGKKGDLVDNPEARDRGRTLPETFWRIEVVRDSYDTDEGIQEILGLIWPQRDAIKEYLKARPSLQAGFTCVVRIHKDRPVYKVSPDSICKLAYLGCEFGMDDIYDFRKE